MNSCNFRLYKRRGMVSYHASVTSVSTMYDMNRMHDIITGSLGYICQPIGSVCSGLVSEPLGRKKAMILVNIPHIIAWTMLYFTSSLEELYIAATLLGLGIGFMEAPIITYVGEIWLDECLITNQRSLIH